MGNVEIQGGQTLTLDNSVVPGPVSLSVAANKTITIDNTPSAGILSLNASDATVANTVTLTLGSAATIANSGSLTVASSNAAVAIVGDGLNTSLSVNPISFMAPVSGKSLTLNNFSTALTHPIGAAGLKVIGTVSLGGLTIGSGGSLTFDPSNNSTLNVGAFNSAGAISNPAAKTTALNATGSVSFLSGSSFTNMTQNTVTMESGGTSISNASGLDLGNLKIANASGTVSLGSDIVLDGNFSQTAAGTFDVTSAPYNLSVAGTWTRSAGIFAAETGTVTFTGASGSITGAMTSAANAAFYDLVFSGTTILNNDIEAADDLTIGSGKTLVAATSQTITVGHDWHGGTYTANSSTVAFDPSKTSHTIYGSTSFNNLKLDASGAASAVTLNMPAYPAS